MVVLRLPHERAALLLDSDHGHRRTLDLERLADRVEALEEFFSHLRPDHAYQRSVFDLVRSDEAALGDILILDDDHIGSHPLDAGEEGFMAVMFEVDAGVELRADLKTGFASIAEPFVILDIEPLVAAHHAFP